MQIKYFHSKKKKKKQKNFDSCIYAYACIFANYINHMCGKNWHLNEMLSDMGLMKVESI